MRKLFSGAAEDLCQPPDSFLMRCVHEGAVAEDIRQGVLASIRVPVLHILRRPKVPPPGHKCQGKENRDGCCYKYRYQNSSSHARKSKLQILRGAWVLTSNVKLARWLSDESSTFNRSIAVAVQFDGRLR
jgi:hypothetical protein